jgi:MFS family permease
MINLGDIPIWFMQAFTVYDLFRQWELIGAFDLILPFLLIFAVIFGVLSTTRILGGHKGVNLIIALVIALMALRLNFVSYFFSELFPRFAIGLAVLIVVVILAALFIPEQHIKGWAIGFAIAGTVIGLIVVIFTFNTTSFWHASFFWQEYWGLIVGGIIMVVLIIYIAISADKKPDPDRSPAKFVAWHPSLR